MTARELAAMEILVRNQVEYILQGQPAEKIEQCLWNAIESGFLLGKSMGVIEGASVTSKEPKGPS